MPPPPPSSPPPKPPSSRAAPFTARIGFEGRQGVLEVAGPGIEPGAVRDAFFFPADWGVIENAAPQALAVRRRGADPWHPRAARRGAAGADRAASSPSPMPPPGVRGAYTTSAAPGAVPAAGGGLPARQAALPSRRWAGSILQPDALRLPDPRQEGSAPLARPGRGAGRGQGACGELHSAGAVLPFLALGGLLIGLRFAGGAAGWGFQFTSLAFVAGMAWLMLAVGLNPSGVFAFSRRAGLLAGTLASRRGRPCRPLLHRRAGGAGRHPCTAPFMAAATRRGAGHGAGGGAGRLRGHGALRWRALCPARPVPRRRREPLPKPGPGWSG